MFFYDFDFMRLVVAMDVLWEHKDIRIQHGAEIIWTNIANWADKRDERVHQHLYLSNQQASVINQTVFRSTWNRSAVCFLTKISRLVQPSNPRHSTVTTLGGSCIPLHLIEKQLRRTNTCFLIYMIMLFCWILIFITASSPWPSPSLSLRARGSPHWCFNDCDEQHSESPVERSPECPRSAAGIQGTASSNVPSKNGQLCRNTPTSELTGGFLVLLVS